MGSPAAEHRQSPTCRRASNRRRNDPLVIRVAKGKTEVRLGPWADGVVQKERHEILDVVSRQLELLLEDPPQCDQHDLAHQEFVLGEDDT